MPTDSVAFDRAVEFYDATRGFPPGLEQPIAALMAQTGGLTKASEVLEIGIGTGRIAIPLAAHVKHYAGIDLSRPMMSRLRAKQTDQPISLIEGDATRLPFASQSFDAVIAVHIFHLIPGWRDALEELVRVLRPNAPLIHGHNHHMPDMEIFKPLIDAYEQVIPKGQYREAGVKLDNADTFLIEAGWQRLDQRQNFPFSIVRTPRQYVEFHEKRMWSQSWQYSDEEHQRLMEALHRTLAESYPDPDQEVEIPTGFNVDIYLPPG